jgi:hypothetical protein
MGSVLAWRQEAVAVDFADIGNTRKREVLADMPQVICLDGLAQSRNRAL